MKEKTSELKTTIELIKQHTYEKNKENTIPEAIISSKKHVIKKNRYKEWKDSVRERKIDRQEKDHADSAEYQIGHNYKIFQRWKQIVSNSGKEDTMPKCADKNSSNNRTVQKLTEEEIDDPSETSSESNESIHHIQEIKEIEKKNKHYTATVKINGKKKKFIIDIGSPITIMPPVEEILISTGLQKIETNTKM